MTTIEEARGAYAVAAYECEFWAPVCALVDGLQRCDECDRDALAVDAASIALDMAIALHFAGRRPSSARQLGIAW